MKQQQQNIKEYLQSKYHPITVTHYLLEINRYLDAVKNPEKAGYNDILAYIGELRGKGYTTEKLLTALLALKQYYHWLVKTGKRNDHPCRSLNLKDKRSKQIQLQDLFSEAELSLLMERKEKYKIVEIKNKVLMSLLIYQGLTTGELCALKVQDINLSKGTVYVKGISNTNSRTIGLHISQIMLLNKYIHEMRPKLLKRKYAKAGSDVLLLNWLGTPHTPDIVDNFIESFKKLFPGRKLNPTRIRQSVIANLLKQGKDVRVVQVYMGYKSPDTIEKYKQSNIEQLQAGIDKSHPLR